MTAQCEWDVSLIAVSENLSLTELSNCLGSEGENGSHDKGDSRAFGSVWHASIWRRNARDTSDTLDNQCKQLLQDLAPDWRQRAGEVQSRFKLIVDVAAYFRRAYCEVNLANDILTEIVERGLDLSITCYPVADDAELIEPATRAEQDQTVAAIREGFADIAAGRSKSAKMTLTRLARKYGIVSPAQ
jgi:hypothetical protein